MTAEVLDTTSLTRSWPRPRVRCECGDELVLRWGEQRRAHFAHLRPTNDERPACAGAEGALHRLAKVLLTQHLNRQRTLSLEYRCGRCLRSCEHGLALAPDEEAREELALASGARVDIGIVRPSDTLTAAIEILYSHRAETAPREDVLWFEVEAMEVLALFHNGLDRPLAPLRCQRQDRRPCGHKDCVPMAVLAKRLGYRGLVQPYDSENAQEREAAIRGQYRLPAEVWLPQSSAPSSESWPEFIRRQRCLSCLRAQATTRLRPFCRGCYNSIARDYDEYGSHWSELWAWVVIPDAEKQRLRDKFAWLDGFALSTPGAACQLCGEIQGAVWWFGHRSICPECFAACDPAKYKHNAKRYKHNAKRLRTARADILQSF